MSRHENGLAYEMFEIAAAINSIANHLEDSDEYAGEGILLRMLSSRLDSAGGRAENVEVELAKIKAECEASSPTDTNLQGKHMAALHVLGIAADHSPDWSKTVWDLAGDATGYARQHDLFQAPPKQ